MNYILYQLLDSCSEGVFALGRDGNLEFLPGDGFDIVVEVNKVCGGLKVDFAMVWVHAFPSAGK